MSNSPNSFLGDYNNPAFDLAKMVIKLREPETDNPKAPALRGFIVATPAKLENLLELAKQQGKQVLYIEVALWPARDAQYKYEGTTSLRESFDASEEKVDAQRSEVPIDMYRI